MILEVVKKLAQRLEDVFSILSHQGRQNGRQELNVASNSKLLFCHGIAQVAQKGTCYWCVQPCHPSCLFSLQGTNKVFNQSFKTPILVFCFVSRTIFTYFPLNLGEIITANVCRPGEFSYLTIPCLYEVNCDFPSIYLNV